MKDCKNKCECKCNKGCKWIVATLALIVALLSFSCEKEIETLVECCETVKIEQYDIDSVDVSNHTITGKNGNDISIIFNGEDLVNGKYIKQFPIAYTDTGLAVYSRQYKLDATGFGAKRLVVNLFVREYDQSFNTSGGNTYTETKFKLDHGEFFFDNGEGTASADKWMMLIVEGDIVVNNNTGILKDGYATIKENTFTSQEDYIPFSFELNVE